MEKGNIDNYSYFQEIWTSPDRYALVKNEFHQDEYAIIDVIDKLFVLIEDEDIKRLVQQKLQENGCKIFHNIREAFNMEPITTDIPMLEDRTTYSVFILLQAEKCNIKEIKAYSAINCVNYLEAKRRLIQKKNFLTRGDAYYIRDVCKKLRRFQVNYEIEPPYPY